MAIANPLPTFGFIPTTFPRDPVEINLYLEHMLIGQVIEPLVSSDRDGNITPGIAQKWTISVDGRTLLFSLRDGIVFSNGRALTAEDVKYSLQRHLDSNSQSKPYLQVIKSIRIVSKMEIEITLHEAHPSLIKALSRDHLGILPKGWVFDKESIEPFTGTGPYRAIKKGTSWHLVVNDLRSNKSLQMIPEWEILLSDSTKKQMTEGKHPTYLPFYMSKSRDDVLSQLGARAAEFEVDEISHFTQSSAWWYPTGKNFLNREIQHRSMCAIRELIELRRSKLNFEKATGVIPNGILGHLNTESIIKCVKFGKSAKTELKIIVAVNPSEKSFLFDAADTAKIEKKLNVKFIIDEALISQQKNVVPLEPDIKFATWSGGFSDPEGFIPILNQLLATNIQTYLGVNSPIYENAKKEMDWKKRTEFYKMLGENIQLDEKMVPAWKLRFFQVYSKKIIVPKNTLRYSPAVADVVLAPSVKDEGGKK